MSQVIPAIPKICHSERSEESVFTRAKQEDAMTPEEVRQLFDYNHWANQRSLEGAAQLSDEQFLKPLGSSFPSVRDTLVHICSGEWVWLERCQGRTPPVFPDVSHIQATSTLREHWGPQAQQLQAFVAGLTQSDLDRVMEYKTFNFGVYKNPVWQSLQHLANHGTYHRGQVATLLRQLGVTPTPTDLMHFYRERSSAASA
jgi:uncharacterized damage-inducible protein DinB